VAAAAPPAEEEAEVLPRLATSAPGAAQPALLSDPSDYTVADDGTIEVQPLETLGHYGDWLEIKTQRLRDLNGLAFRTPVELGQRLRLDLDTVDAKTFEQRRIAYHRLQQDRFFRRHVITDVVEHEIRRGDSIWVVALRKYDVPLWLFRQYNPGLDLHQVRPGTRVQIPVLSDAGDG
jgi:membrane-bound lytic murein transglycosylase D